MKIHLVALAPLVGVACAPLDPLPPAAVITRAADVTDARLPAAPAPGVDYSRYRVAEPDDWRRLNDAQKGT